MERIYGVEAVWHEYANDVRGKPIDAGHYLAEERPDETKTVPDDLYQDLRTFFG